MTRFETAPVTQSQIDRDTRLQILDCRTLYLALLLLLKAMGSLVALVRPIALMLPRWSHGEDVLALLIVLSFCFVIGVVFRFSGGRVVGSESKVLYSRRSLATYSFEV